MAIVKALIVLLIMMVCHVHAKVKVPFHRFFNRKNVDYLYTTNNNELTNGKDTWENQGVQCKILKYCFTGSVPLYRYRSETDHFYTTNITEVGTSVRGVKGRYGYTSEGVAGYCYLNHKEGTIPLYRYYNSARRTHFFTTDVNEIGTHPKGQIGQHGTKDEGVACYVYPAEQN